MQIKKLLLIAPAALLLNACSSDSNYDFEQSIANQAAEFDAFIAANPPEPVVTPEPPPSMLFDPANGVIPFPNSLLFGADGTVNAPADATNPADPALALNQMDGFSTTSPLSAGLSEAVDPATVLLGSTVRVFEVTTTPQGAVTGIVAELGATEVAVVPTASQIAILPLQPLKEKTSYVALVTNGVMTAGDTPQALTPSTSFQLAKLDAPLLGAFEALEPVRQLTSAMLAAAAGEGVVADDVVLAWSFKTQSVRDVLQAVKDQVAPGALVLAPAGSTTTDFNPALQGKADVYIGTLDVPYYQNADPAAALSSIWLDANGNPVNQFSPTPVATGTVTIPVLMSIPNAASAAGGTAPENGWPITIFQHGITRNRTDMLAASDALADAGRAVIAIDIPMHGLVDTNLPIHADNTAFPGDAERTLSLDFVANATLAPGPDGAVDASGTHFYNLQNLGNSRDNLRQGIADLMVLSASLASAIDPTGAAVGIDASNVTFVGHSLGAMIGTTFLSYDTSIAAATLAMPGGGIAQLLANSGSFGAAINGGLTAAGAAPGTAAYDQFLVAAQTVIDSADPINSAQALATTGKNIHLIEVIGDQTIPNAVATAPLSGTTPLARQMGLTQVSGSTSGSALVRFTEGDHGSIINPAGSLAAFIEMQTQMASYAASLGSVLPITNTAVIEAAP